MRNILIPVCAAILLLVAGVFILNAQLWYSLREDRLAGAHYAAQNIATILNEAKDATRVAVEVSARGCDSAGQYQLGTEAAVQPHLRTLVILSEGKVWCTSLPGNNVLLRHLDTIPEKELSLIPAKNAVDNRPVMLFQRHFAGKRIIVSVSDRHIRDAMNTPYAT